MKKILIFSTAYLPMIGGAEIAVKEITDRLGKEFIFDLICARIKKELPSREKIGNINVYRIGWGCVLDKYYLVLRGYFFAVKLHEKNNYNAIWAIMASYGGFAAMFFKKKHPDVPFLLTLQEGDPPDYIKKRVGTFGGWFEQIFTRADYIQAISNFLAGWAKDMGVKRPIEVVPNGIDPEKYELRIKNYELRNRLGIKENERVVITTSRLVKKNGIGDLIGAINHLTINNKKLVIKLLILGTGPLEKKLKFQVLSSKLRDCVLFLGDMPNADVPKYLAMSDVFARPSLSEGLGNSFLEAMAAGVPIIGTPVGGIPDFIFDGETGLFCEVGNPKSIAEKITLLLSDDALRQKIIASARQLVEEKYNWRKIAEQMKAIFERLKN